MMGLMPSFFQMIPPMTRGMFPSNVVVYVPYLFVYCLLLIYVRPVRWQVFALSFFGGVAYVLTFMNGIASINKTMTTEIAIYAPTQQLNWIAAIGWAVFSVAVVLNKEWAVPVGIGAGLLGTVAGSPLGILSTLLEGGFSMFYPAPALSLALLIHLIVNHDKTTALLSEGKGERRKTARKA